jgi:predicted transcriptional regulator
MKRTSVFLTEDLERLLREAARRTHRPQAEVIRDALELYFQAQPRSWPRSVGMGENSDLTVTSENVKDWVRETWLQETGAGGAKSSSSAC